MNGAPVNQAKLPLIGVTGGNRQVDALPHHVAGDKYVTAVTDGAEALAVAIPSIGDAADGGRLEIGSLIEHLDGLLVTGAPSNVEPHRYGGAAARDGTASDPMRDATTLPLIGACLAAGVPLLGLCRGHQEVNVALGGTLHQQVHELPGKLDHREPTADDKADDKGDDKGDDKEDRTQVAAMEIRYGPRHEVRLTPGGVLDGIAQGLEVDGRALIVNSLHAQAIDRLAPGLSVEAVAPDGVVEAVSVDAAAAFAVAVQWHPEYRVLENPFSLALFRAFGAAARERLGSRQ